MLSASVHTGVVVKTPYARDIVHDLVLEGPAPASSRPLARPFETFTYLRRVVSKTASDILMGCDLLGTLIK